MRIGEIVLSIISHNFDDLVIPKSSFSDWTIVSTDCNPEIGREKSIKDRLDRKTKSINNTDVSIVDTQCCLMNGES